LPKEDDFPGALPGKRVFRLLFSDAMAVQTGRSCGIWKQLLYDVRNRCDEYA